MRTLPLFVLALVSLNAPVAFAEPSPVLADYSFPNEWITPQQWPSVGEVLSTDEEPECDTGTTMNSTTTYDDDLLGWSACVAIAREGAAGSVYHTYTYNLYREDTGTAVSIEWSLRQVQCANYDEPMRAECERGQDAFWREYDPNDVVEASLLAMLFVPDHDCRPYQCANGTTIESCDEHRRITNFVEPCGDHGGAKNPFMDVSYDEDPFMAEAVAYVKAEGIVEGYADGTFRPYATINRAEFVKILIEAHYGNDGPGAENCMQDVSYIFPDVHRSLWYAKYACSAKNMRFVEGYPDGSFRGANSINFVEAAKILTKAYGLEASTTIPACEGDCPWYRDYVLMLEMRRAIPMTIASFDARITRGEMAEMIYLLEKNVTNMSSKSYQELMR